MIAPTPIASNNNNNNNNNNKQKSDSDSSDWDSDDDFTSRKISINIKPICQNNEQKVSSSVDELRATVGTWKTLANVKLVKPNSRRHHQGSLQLAYLKGNLSEQANPQKLHNLQKPNVPCSSVHGMFLNVSRLPVAFAVQECLESRLVQGLNAANSQHLIGHVKMAVPPCLANPLSTFDEQDLEFTLISQKPHNSMQVNENFVMRLKGTNIGSKSAALSCDTFRVDMRAVREFARKRNRTEPRSKYFLLPELIRYYIHSGAAAKETRSDGVYDTLNKPKSDSQLNPVNVVSHWLCDLNVTKVRIDVALLDCSLTGLSIEPNEIKNLKISLQINGDVSSYHSKPDANWNPLDSRLTWAFANLADFIQRSSNDGTNSCLAKFNLNDGPSRPGNVNVQFSINNKTLTCSRIALTNSDSFCLAMEKFEVKSSVTEVR